mmetsp:Transcript_21524/g.36922  ORF Transcript_21524/g.36922 Transcript_21524/m.36922 type:complete len:229 (-) Transcript_21524:139-825(-)|eukprot:CAMPEP_0196662226 /NCGR_PEP_ID=MMETSP1086-20130531/47774_1 /TAXON_ID=77921 /ORGANISM="Cyanoptyche  gloeocystis , Strain SAG4.97" /LENGTH=228 /DNA_ID=CAMNT_0041997495 /DNA_START=69 /DNA_END=755 /DNA_ORIENTATION=+
MRKLVEGVLDFKRRLGPSMQGLFRETSKGQTPDCLFVGCSDSRVVPNLFSSTNPGDLFVMRNVGNIIPPAGTTSRGDRLSEGAAVEFSVGVLGVKHIIVCGHSECGAMKATNSLNDPNVKQKPVLPPHVAGWLRYGAQSAERFQKMPVPDPKWSVPNQLSQVNVLQQLENLMTYEIVKEKVLDRGSVELHAWWYDVGTGDVYVYDKLYRKFVILDDFTAKELYEDITL